MPKTVVVITSMPPRTQSYFDWLLTGLGILHEEGKIELRFEDHLWNKVLRLHPRVMGAAWANLPAIWSNSFRPWMPFV